MVERTVNVSIYTQTSRNAIRGTSVAYNKGFYNKELEEKPLEEWECVFVSSKNQEDKYIYGVRKLLDEAAEGQNSTHLILATRTFEGRQYLYAPSNRKDFFIEWGKGLGMLFSNIFHNIFFKCIGVLVCKFLIVCGVGFKKSFCEEVDRMWKEGTPWKALIALVVQIGLNCLSFISFGFLSRELNRISGYVELKTLGDQCSQKTYTSRIKVGWYAAPCESPRAILPEGISIKTNETVNIKKMVSPDQLRYFVQAMLYPEYKKSIPKDYVNFPNVK